MSLLLLLRNHAEAGPPGEVTFTAAFVQEVTAWDAAVLTAPVTEISHGGWRKATPAAQEFSYPVDMVAHFRQEPATWKADIDVSHDAVELGLTEESVLVLI